MYRTGFQNKTAAVPPSAAAKTRFSVFSQLLKSQRGETAKDLGDLRLQASLTTEITEAMMNGGQKWQLRAQ
jgi:hypothetical protein